MTRQHKQEVVGVCKPEWGRLEQVEASADNRSFALMFGSRVDGEESVDESSVETDNKQHHLVYQNELVVSTLDLVREINFSLSFDGKRLAVARLVTESDGIWRYDVSINGQPAYRGESYFFIYRLNWVDNDRLVWSGWFERPDENRRRGGSDHKCFVNGKDATGSFVFEPVWGERGKSNLIVIENGRRYVVKDDGTRALDRPACCNSTIFCRCNIDKESQPQRIRPTEERSGPHNLVSVTYRGVTGEQFDEIENHSGLGTYAFNEDKSRVGYIGIRHSGMANKIGRFVASKMQKAGDKEHRSGKVPWWGWPIALLFNPYFGVGHAWYESSKRYYPVNHGQRWAKGYKYAGDCFFTPANELVVTVADGKKSRVVIDEDEGPPFDQIFSVRFLAKEDCLTYLAKSGSEIIRVTVS